MPNIRGSYNKQGVGKNSQFNKRGVTINGGWNLKKVISDYTRTEITSILS